MEQQLDILIGVEAIAEFCFGETTPTTVRRTRYWLDTKRLPAGKFGRIWVGSRAKIAEHVAAITSGTADAGEEK